MLIWVTLSLLTIQISGEEQILSRKKRIDEVNEDYDDKALEVEENHKKIHEEAIQEAVNRAQEIAKKQHDDAVKAAHDPDANPELHEEDFTFEMIDSEVLGSEELKTETKTQTETVHHKMEIEIDIPVMDNPEDVAKKIHEAIHKSSHDSSLINNAIKFNQELRNTRPNVITSESEDIDEDILQEMTPEVKLRNDYQAYYKGVTVTQYANGIDHLEPEDLIGDDLSSKLCLDLWIINGIVTKGCTTDWREDQRPWCSLDAIFQGKFIFCPETEEEKTSRENKLKAKTLFQEGIGEMNGWDIRKSIIRGGYEKAVESLNLGFEEASGFIAFFKLMGYFTPLNIKEARQLAEEGATKGQPVDQDVIAFMHALGVGYEANQAKAILNWTFGALGGSVLANMALGYRYSRGITVAKSCPKAREHYQLVARVVIEDLTYAGGNAKQMLPINQLSMANLDESGIIDTDMLNYWELLFNQGNNEAGYKLADLYLTRGYEPDFRKAADILRQLSSLMPQAAARLGRLFIDGRGVGGKDYNLAYKYLKQAKDQKDPMGMTFYGILFQDGYWVDRTSKLEIFKLFQDAAKNANPEAQYRVGLSYLTGYGTPIDVNQAVKYLQLSAQNRNIRAIYKLGELHHEGKRVPSNCEMAMEMYKNVAERGSWARFFMQAGNQYKNEHFQSAYMLYSVLAELGYSTAQTNVAELLENHEININGESAIYPRALMHLQRAAEQGNYPARLKVGDYTYYGNGIEADPSKAAYHYRIAAEEGSQAQAFFNLGWMHQHGIGLEKDKPLAKRYYDNAMAVHPDDAMIPCSLALLSLMTEDYRTYLSGAFDGLTAQYMSATLSDLVETYVGPEWDLYLGCFLLFILTFVVAFRRQN